MPWPPRLRYTSKRFNKLTDLAVYFKDLPEQSALADAILFLSEEIQLIHDHLESQDNEFRGYDT
jgi:hypothetical protein